MSNKPKRRSDKFWERFFDDYNLENHFQYLNTFYVSTDDIKSYGEEPRLVSKFDHKNNLPYIFNQYNLGILPNSRKGYVIGKFDLYEKLNYKFSNNDIKIVTIPYYIKSLRAGNLTSEAISLHAIVVSNILQDFIGEEIVQTISGRMSSKNIDFNLNTIYGSVINFSVQGSQVEVDGGYEGVSNLALIEAKQHDASDFLVRQLYYPYRVYFDKGLGKHIRNIYMTFSNDIFTLYEFDFINPYEFNSIQLVKKQQYMIDFEKITMNDIIHVFKNVKFVKEPKLGECPYPQADTFSRIIDLLSVLYEKDLSFDAVTTRYDFDPRQTDYYKNSAKYLGLVDEYKEDKMKYFTLTDKGIDVIESEPKDKYLKIVGSIFSHRPFYDTFELHLKTNKNNLMNVNLDKINVAKLIEKHFKGYSESTYIRRARTTLSWMEWIIELTKKVQ